jgi:hypothetical protein
MFVLKEVWQIDRFQQLLSPAHKELVSSTATSSVWEDYAKSELQRCWWLLCWSRSSLLPASKNRVKTTECTQVRTILPDWLHTATANVLATVVRPLCRHKSTNIQWDLTLETIPQQRNLIIFRTASGAANGSKRSLNRYTCIFDGFLLQLACCQLLNNIKVTQLVFIFCIVTRHVWYA